MKYTQKRKTLLFTLLTLSVPASLEAAYAQASGSPQNTDFCFMRTAEGEYVSLNYLCQPSSSVGRPTATSDTTTPEENPIPTSAPAQTPSSPTQSVSPGETPFPSNGEVPFADETPSVEDAITPDTTDSNPFRDDNTTPEPNEPLGNGTEPLDNSDNPSNFSTDSELPTLN